MRVQIREYGRYSGKRKHPVFMVLLCIVLAGVICFGALEGIVLAGAQTRISAEPDVMVILGTRMYDSGPSVLLQDRLTAAADYLKDHPDLPIIVAGGQGKDEPVSEAQGMRDYLMALGIDEGRIWMEDQSHSTHENLVNTKRLLGEKGYDIENTRLLVVSNGFHLARVRLLADRFGLEADTLAAPSTDTWTRVLRAYVRESMALVKSFLFDR